MSNTLGTKRLGTVLALIVAFAIALAMIVTPAARAVEAGPSTPTHNVGNIDTTKTDGQIIVHKYTAPIKNGSPNDGTELSGAQLPSGDKLEGVKFTLYKVSGIDLKQSADWEKLKLIQNGSIADDGQISGVTGVSRGAPVTGAVDQPTDADGKVTFSNLPVGAYIVVESDFTGAKKAGTQDAVKVTAPAKPFVVTVPFPTTKAVANATNGWLYTVNVYPKNEITNTPTKALDLTDSAHSHVAQGGELSWKITIPIPAVNDPFTEFFIYDNLKNGTVQGTTTPKVQIEDPAGTLTDVPAADYDLSALGQAAFKVTFKGNGLGLLDSKKGKKVVVTLYAEVKTALTKDPTTGKTVVNDDYGFQYNNKKVPPTTPPTTTPPTAYFGDFNLHKVSTVGSADLTGAEFDIYATEQGAKDQTEALKVNHGGAIKSQNGIVAFKDLLRGDNDGATQTYWVREVKAPVGFKLPTGDDAITQIEVTKTTGSGTTGDKNFSNTPITEVPDLPLTGASGKLMMTLGGAAIVLFAAGTVLVTRRRKA